MMNNDYATQNLLESLFGKSSYSFKNLNEEEQKALRTLGYQVIDWDLALSEGKVNREDLSKRVALYKQLLTMDEEVRNRKPKREPKFKKGDVVKIKKEIYLIKSNTTTKDNKILYSAINSDGQSTSFYEEEAFLLLQSKG